MTRPLAVLAVMFGSQYSCFGFSTSEEPTKVCSTRTWGKNTTLKVPTSILIESGEKFAAIGFEAEQMYEERLAESGDLEDWWLFRNFIDLINTQAYVKDVVLQDTKGRSLPATKVLSMAIKCMVDKFKTDTSSRCCDLRLSDDMTFVFTVPTSWSATAKKCMKVAAAEAGLPDDKLVLVCESEAASIMCQQEMNDLGKDKTLGTKFLLVKWDDYELEVSLLETKFDETMRVNFLNKFTNFGMTVLNKFFTWLARQFGIDDANKIKSSFDTLDLRLMTNRLKKLSLASANRKVVMAIDANILDMLRERNQMALPKGVSLIRNKLKMDIECVEAWFRESIDTGISHIKKILSEQDDVTDILLFGDFMEYAIVRESVLESLGKRIIIPECVETAVIKGAVIYGHCPEIVASRITKSLGNAEPNQDKEKLPLVVASFDIGTTYSGFAYSYTMSRRNIFSNKSWHSGQQLLSLKAPTSVLLDPEKKFDSFGYDAENKFSSLAEEDEHHDWILFSRFKMALHNTENLNRDMTVKAINGKEMLAMTIFAMVISYMKDELVKTIQKSKDGVEENDILYMLTVPAIWDDAAKQFMKEAAIMAGIDDERIRLVLEPEAASVWCQKKHTDARHALSEVGTQFMVADIGGGTTDISVQEKLSNGRLKEIHRASGGAWGGTNVDRNFLKWLTALVGEKTMVTFKEKNMIDFIELEREFEIKKRNVNNDKPESLVIKVPLSLIDIHELKTGSTLADSIVKLHLNGVSHKGDKLKVPLSVAKSWFTTPITEIVEHIRGILDEKKMKKVNIVMLVGGFSECLLLQYKFCFELRDKKLVIPEEGSIAVMHGGVEYGMKQNVIASRIMKFAYGIAKTVAYNSTHHDKSKAKRQGIGLVVDVFECFVDVDDEIPDGETVTKGFVPAETASTHIRVYSSTEPNPKYVTDPGCKQIGQLMIGHPEGMTLEDKIFNVQFEFGKTEIVVTIVKQKSGEETSTRIDCL